MPVLWAAYPLAGIRPQHLGGEREPKIKGHELEFHESRFCKHTVPETTYRKEKTRLKTKSSLLDPTRLTRGVEGRRELEVS